MASNLTANMLPAEINQKLNAVEHRTMLTRIQTGLLKTAACFLALLLLSMLIDGSLVLFHTSVRLILTLTVLGLTGVVLCLKVIQPYLKRDSLDQVARQVDLSVPELEERWSTILNLSGRHTSGTSTAVMLDQVRSEAQDRGRFVNPEQIVDRQELLQWRNILLALAAALLIPFLFAPMQMLVLLSRFWLPFADISLVKLDSQNKNLIVPIEESLTLSTLLTSGDANEAMLFITPDGEGEQQISLSLVTEGVESPRYLHQIKSVAQPFTYRWRAGDGQTELYRVDIAERPEFEQIKFKLTPPAYTELPKENLNELPPRVRAVKGSQLSIEFRISQPLDTMTLDMANSDKVILNAISDRTFEYNVALEKSFSFSPHLMNEYGLANRKPPLCRITVYEDRAPAVTIVTPDDEISVPGDDVIDIEFMARDDFAITKAELVLYKENPLDPNGPPVESKVIDIPLGEQQDKSYLSASTTLDLNELDLQNDDVLSYAVRVYDSKENVSNPESNADFSPAQTPLPSQNQPNGHQQTGDQNGNSKNNPSTDQQNNKGANSNGSKPSDSAQASSEDSKNSSSENSPSASSQQQGSQPQGSQQKSSEQTGSPSGPSSPQDPSQQNAAGEATNPSEINPQGSNSPSSNTGEGKSSSPSGSPSQQSGGASSGSSSEGESQQKPEQETRQIRIGEEQDNAEQNVSDKSQQNGNANSQQAGNPSGENMPSPSSRNVPQTNETSDSPASSPTTNDQGDFEPLPFSPEEKEGQDANKRPSPEEVEPGATPPPNDMGRRMLDVEQQNSTSSKQRIMIDEFASRFEGQRRKKYQMAIDPILKKLKELLTSAQKNSDLYNEYLQSSTETAVAIPQSYKLTAQQLKQSISAIQELKQKSSATPYAFIGLQVDSIQVSHVEPAADLWGDLLKLETKEERQPLVDKTIFHIERALVLLEQLTRKYENVKRDEEIADKVERIDKLYQVYLEDSLTMLGNEKPVNNVTEGKPFDTEFSDEYLQKLEEILKKRQEIYAELAKILAEDPRLLKRFMDSVENQTTLLREQLSEMNLAQQRITREGEYWIEYQKRVKAADEASAEEGSEKTDRPFPKALLERHQQQVYSLVESSGAIHDKFVTWLPKQIDGAEADIKKFNDRAAALTTQANELIETENSEQAARAKELIAAYEEFQNEINEIYPNASNELKEHLGNRVAQIDELNQDLESWVESAEAYGKGDYLGAAEIDQFNLLDETFVFVSKFQALEPQLAGFPSEVRKMAADLKRKLQIDAAAAMTSSETALFQDKLEESLEHQQQAHIELDAAEKLFDAMLDRMMEEINKQESGTPDPDDLEVGFTLEDLLAMLERERLSQERTLLAILRRPSNLQLIMDWMNPSAGGAGGGMGGIVSAQFQQQRLNRLQSDLLKNAQAQRNQSGARQTDWNKLISTLEEGMKQNQGKLTPEQYRAAIDQYFEVLARELAEER
ncbi:hypothetical protein Pla110_01780 [Polystyrenella longa]|uniref:DUF4175 family protein n=1 Tax=Polystyrenella longa TaxID=2528007 RepID=A0A518CH26_9PLAN|nr:hypothetical protein [Polystyrenella longa]QDU78474.1 hypothetical protein Pla110_01780 [Polystyrenella longa]